MKLPFVFLFLICACSRSYASPHTSGIVIYRDKNFYQNNLVDVFVYNNYLDKGASTAANYGGYYIFIGLHGSKVQVPANVVIANITYDEVNPENICFGNSFDSYLTTYLRVLDLMKINQNVGMVLSPLAEHMKSNLDRIKAGDSYSNYGWISNNNTNTVELVKTDSPDISSVLEKVLTRAKSMLGAE